MSKILFLIVLFFGVLFLYPQIYGIVKTTTVSIVLNPSQLDNQNPDGINVEARNLRSGSKYHLTVGYNNGENVPISANDTISPYNPEPDGNGIIAFHLCPPRNDQGWAFYATNDCKGRTFKEGGYSVSIYEGPVSKGEGSFLADARFTVIVKTAAVIEFLNNNFTTSDDIIIQVNGAKDGSYKIMVDGDDPRDTGSLCKDANNGNFEANIGTYYEGSHEIQIYTRKTFLGSPWGCNKGSLVTYRSFTIKNDGTGGPGSGVGIGTTSPPRGITVKRCRGENEPPDEDTMVCALSGGQEAPGCTDNPNNPGIATAIGCIHTNPAELVKDLMTWVLGISGGLAFLMMLLGAFQMLTSAGNPDTLRAGRERLTSAVIGLLFVIFAVLLLQIIGVGILNIPGFK